MADPKIVEYLARIQEVTNRYMADSRLIADIKGRNNIRNEISSISREMEEYRRTKYNRRR